MKIWLQHKDKILDSNSPNPSVETLLHAFIPHKYIDHTHSLAVLALANQPNAIDMQKYFGDRVAIVPYVMPGFDLAIAASKAFEKANKNALSKGFEIEGMVLTGNHGIFSFGKTAKIKLRENDKSRSYC